MFQKVLVPIDDSEIAPAILPYVSYLARSLEIPVLLMSAVDSREKADNGYGKLEDYSIAGSVVEATNEGRQLLRGFLEPLSREEIDVDSAVAVGTDPAVEILNFAQRRGCDLIAMATHDRNLLGQAIKGSVTNEVLRSAQIPVLAITPERSDEGPGNQAKLSSVLVPLDGSPFGESVLPYVEHLAQRLSLHVVLVRALRLSDVNSTIGAADHVGAGSVRVPLMADQAAEDEAAEYLGEIAARLSVKGLDVRWEVVRGDAPARVIADLAEGFSNNVIALASHSRSGIMRWVMGSVAEDLLRSTGDPVLVIPANVAEPELG